MLARLYILMPYTLTLPEGGKFNVYEIEDGDYKVRFLPPQRDPSVLFGKRPEGLKLNGTPAFEANVMRIDFHKKEFNRTSGGPIDPPEDVIRRAVDTFHSRLRFTTRAAHASPVSFPGSRWRLDYTNDDGSELQVISGQLTGLGTLQFQWSFIGIPPETWDTIFKLPPKFEVPVWDGLRLDALAALPSVGTAVVLAASSLEVFISMLLDQLASQSELSVNLWAWLTEREGKILQQPSVEEQFDVLLKELTGHSLKEDAKLWEAFKNLKSARNSFVHEGIARVGTTKLTKDDARALVGKVDAIITQIREWTPAALQWPVPQTIAKLEWTQMLIEHHDSAGQSNPARTRDR